MKQPNNLVELLEQSVSQHADRPALVDPLGEGRFETWTYAQLWRDLHRVGAKLRQLGVGQGERIGLLAESRAWWPVADLAIMSIGACTVPIYPSVPANQAEYIIKHAEISGIFVQNLKQLRKLLEINADELSYVRFVVLLEAEAEEETVAPTAGRLGRIRVESGLCPIDTTRFSYHRLYIRYHRTTQRRNAHAR